MESRIDQRESLAVRSLFVGVDASTLAAIESALEWFSLPAGSILFREGDAGDDLYVVVSGRLEARVRNGQDGETVVAQIAAGEVVGEMALISGEPRSATVVARRDSELVRLTKTAFETLIERYPKAMLPLSRLVVRRLRSTTHGASAAVPRKTLALVPLARGLPIDVIGTALCDALSALGKRVLLLDRGVADRASEWFNNIEADHDLIIYLAEPDTTDWTQFCLRQADYMLLVAQGDAILTPDSPPQRLLADASQCHRALIVLDNASAALPTATSRWLQQLPVDLVCHLRLGNKGDLARLARFVTCQSVRLVLSGGGARGFAHLGAIRALREAGVSFDLVGGTSIGAIIAAGIALEWNYDELSHRLRRAFVDTNPLSDYTLPLIALVKGRKVTKLLQDHFGDVCIEDLWLPYYCVSSNLTTGNIMVHRSGPLWHALRASIAIPGVLPPVAEAGDLLVDGGVLDNFPVDVMSTFGRGPIVGVDVASGKAFVSAPAEVKTPGIVRLLMRAGTVSSEVQARACRRMADLLLEPPLSNVDMLNWQSFDLAVEIGYHYTIDALHALDRSGNELLQNKSVCMP